MMTEGFTIRLADWQQDQEALRLIREQVFVIEQHVPVELEWDGIDEQCIHAIAEDTKSKAIGTARLLPDGHIGRMAVLQDWRNRGIGRALLKTLMEVATDKGISVVRLNAQTQALAFYEQAGFVAFGDEFMEANIPHRHMKFMTHNG